MREISVVIPMYNATKTIIDSLESVRKQEYKDNLEIIIVNDGSADNSLDVVKKYKTEYSFLDIIIIDKKNSGVASARNRGMKVAKYELIAFLDSDDEWLEEKLNIMIPYFDNDKIDFLGSGRNGVPLKVGLRKITKLTRILPKDLVFRWNPQPSTVVLRKNILSKVGFFDESFRYAEEGDYWLRIAYNCGFFVIPDSLVMTGHGKHDYCDSGLSSNLKMMHVGELSAIKNACSNNMISLIMYILAKIFARIKYFRRVLVFSLREKYS